MKTEKILEMLETIKKDAKRVNTTFSKEITDEIDNYMETWIMLPIDDIITMILEDKKRKIERDITIIDKYLKRGLDYD